MNRTRTILAAALVALLALSITGCSNRNLAARVNGEPITMEALDQQVEQLKAQYGQMFEGADGEGRLLDFKQRLLDQLINQELVRQAAEEKGIKVTDADVSKQIEQLKTGFTDDKQFEQALATANMTLDTLKDSIREQLLTQKLLESLSADEKVTDAQIAEYYKQNETQFYQAAAKRSSHILFKPEQKKLAQQALDELEDGADFAATAKKYSQDTATAPKGGDLGWPTTPLAENFQKAVDKLDVGEVSGLVQTPYGWHIIMVTDSRKASQKKLADVKEDIKEILVQQRQSDAYVEYVNELREKAEIEILLPDLKEGAGSTETTSK